MCVLKGYQKNILQPKAECKNTVLQRELLIISFAVFGVKNKGKKFSTLVISTLLSGDLFIVRVGEVIYKSECFCLARLQLYIPF